jgi:hypothetical protein
VEAPCSCSSPCARGQRPLGHLVLVGTVGDDLRDAFGAVFRAVVPVEPAAGQAVHLGVATGTITAVIDTSGALFRVQDERIDGAALDPFLGELLQLAAGRDRHDVPIEALRVIDQWLFLGLHVIPLLRAMSTTGVADNTIMT